VLAPFAFPAPAAAVPAPPTLTVGPPSPANDNTPVATGLAPGLGIPATVRIYTTAGCAGPEVASGTPIPANGVYVIPLPPVPDDSTTVYYVTATDSSGTSMCMPPSGISYVEDSTAPPTPSVDGSAPASPSDDETPELLGTAEPGATVAAYAAADCGGPAVGSGTADATGAFRVLVLVADNSTTTLYAVATDAAGNSSSCSDGFTYVEVTTAPPPAPVVTGTTPASPSNDGTPLVQGTSAPDTTIRVYSTSDCSGPVLGTGIAAPDASFSVETLVAEDTTTTLRATATSPGGTTSACSSTSVEYVEDSTAPAPPTIAGSTPGSPSNELRPSIFGSAEPGATVFLYVAHAPVGCAGFFTAVGTAAAFASPGLTAGSNVSVPPDFQPRVNGTNWFSARAVDAAGNTSGCSAAPTPFLYVNDSIAPAGPTLTGSVPASPSGTATPTIVGTAEPGSTVRLYTTAGCTGVVAGTAAADAGGAVAVPVTVADGSSTTFRAVATDAASNPSGCSGGFTYVHDSAPVIAAKKGVIVESKAAPVVVLYASPTASDARDGAVPVSCAPPSGSKFPLGTTDVTCTATDRSGNSAKSGFGVLVRLPTTPGAVTAPHDPSLVLTLVAPNQRVRVSAGGFAPRSSVRLVFVTATGGHVALGKARVGRDGRFDVKLAIPRRAPLGDTQMTAIGVDPDGGELVRAWALTVAVPGRLRETDDGS
jgi:hypothetical protein